MNSLKLSVVIIALFSCNTTPPIKDFSTNYYDYEITLKKDTMGFGKLGDNLVFKNNRSSFYFQVNAVDSIWESERDSSDIVFEILSHVP